MKCVTEMKDKKKILVITNHSYMLWQFRRELIATLMEQHEIVLVMPFVGHEEDFQKMGLRCINTELERRGSNPFKDFKLLRTYGDILEKEQPDLVITYSIKPNIYAGLACKRRKIPYAVNVQGLGTAFERGGAMAKFVTVLYTNALKKAKVIFFENTANAEEFQRRGIVTLDRCKILNGAGINLDHYTYQEYPDNDKIRFLYLGRIMTEKGVRELFEAMTQLYEAGHNVMLDLVGFFEDEFKEFEEDYTSRPFVEFHGFQPEARPYYTKADCIVLPSYHEGMSNVLLEAASMGRPVITSNIPGCREAVEEGVNGYLAEVKNAQDLLQKMEAFITLTRAQRQEMGRKGREKMEREFAKAEVVAETIRALGL